MKIQINREKCVGCGLCANACHQSAIEMVEGKAKVVRENSCDGLGRCLPVCPVSAISFLNVEENQGDSGVFSCPSTQSHLIMDEKQVENIEKTWVQSQSALRQWPVQIKLVPVTAPYFNGADLLVAADCSAFSYANFHDEFMKNKVTLIGCPKLDEVDYSEKMTQIIRENQLKSITVVRMEVPCCGGIVNAVVTAMKQSGKNMPLDVVTLSINGQIL